jgi:starvation-inducible DNA-binding protein
MNSMKTFPTRIDLAGDIRLKVIPILNHILADTTDLFTQTKQAHWAVKGPNFIALHELFDKFAEQLEDAVDEIAERVTALGGLPTGTARQAAQHSRIPEYPHEATSGLQHVTALSERFAILAKSTRAAIDTTVTLGDAGTADLLTGFSRDLDKNLWFLESHLQ